MIGFIAGLVLGGIVGVVCDRLWRRFENIVRVEISGGHFGNIEGQEGFNFTVRNVGMTEIPAYRIGIFHPRRGTLFPFETKTPGSLLPGQEDHHECLLLQQGNVDGRIANWFLTIDGKPLTENDAKSYSFQLTMTKGDRLLYESRAIGNALANQVRKVCQQGNFKGIAFEEAMTIQTRRHLGVLSRMGWKLQCWNQKKRRKKSSDRGDLKQDTDGNG